MMWMKLFRNKDYSKRNIVVYFIHITQWIAIEVSHDVNEIII